MDVAHLLSRLRIRTARKAKVSRYLNQELRGAQKKAGLLAYIWVPFLRPVVHPRITFSRFGRRVEFWPKTYYDLEVWRDVFEDDDCDIDLNAPPRVILDLGAHVGLTTMYYAMKYPEAKILAIEAEPSNYQQLARNVAQFENVVACHYAVCGDDRPVELFVHPRSVSHSLVDRSADGTKTVVQGRSLDSLLAEHGIERVDLIKFNIEGMEFDVLEGFSRRAEVGAYIGYMHYDLARNEVAYMVNLFEGYAVMEKPSKPMRSKIYAVNKDSSIAN